MNKRNQQLKKFMRKNTINLVIIAISTLGLAYFSLPAGIGLASEMDQTEIRELKLEFEALQNQVTPYGNLPESGYAQPRKSLEIPVTAYSSTVWQCDSTPFITASGTHVRDGVIAANFLPIGTRVRFPELYGDKIFIVEDRMNARYTYRADIWMETTGEAVDFGINYTTIEIF